jgi:Ca2+-binding EF-hand superfamily protein
VRRGFRLLDADHSGFLTRAEFRNLDDMFNLDVEKRVMDALIKLADYDNTGKICFAEFSRLITADDVLHLKDTLCADPEAAHDFGGDHPQGDIRASLLPRVPQLRPGVKPMEVRAAQKHLMKAIAHKYESPREAFEDIDKDGEGTLSRYELMGMMMHLNTGQAMREVVLHNLIDFCDMDSDGSVNYDEFIQVLEKENILNAGTRPGYLF